MYTSVAAVKVCGRDVLVCNEGACMEGASPRPAVLQPSPKQARARHRHSLLDTTEGRWCNIFSVVVGCEYMFLRYSQGFTSKQWLTRRLAYFRTRNGIGAHASSMAYYSCFMLSVVTFNPCVQDRQKSCAEVCQKH